MEDTALTTLVATNNLNNATHEQLFYRTYFYHDVRIACETNDAACFGLLDSLLGRFPQPQHVRGNASYSIFCYPDEASFPVQLPERRTRTGAVQLLTGTRLKYYTDNITGHTIYQRFMPYPSVNEPVLTVIIPGERRAVTQLVALKHYDTAFLRRYVLLLALGELLRCFQFEPCHAAAISAISAISAIATPWDTQQGALILGTSGSGKTTLSIGCTLAGCGLVGDDLVLLRAQEGQAVTACAILPEVSIRPTTLDLWSSLSFLRSQPVDARDKRYCSIEQLHPGASCLEVPIDLLIFPSLTDEAKTTVTPLNRATTLQWLIQLCISNEGMYVQQQERLFSLLSQLAEQAQGYQLAIARGDRESPQRLLSLFKGINREPHHE